MTTQVSLENVSNLERKLTIIMPSEEVEEAVEANLKKLMSTVKLPGFRPGKIPYKVIKSRFGSGSRAETIKELIQTSLHDAIVKEELQPVALPMIDELDADEGKPLKIVASFEVFPKIDLVDFENMEIEKVTVDLTDADVDDMLSEIRETRAKWTDVERAAETGDRVTIDYDSIVDGKEATDEQLEEASIVIGRDRFFPGFDEELVGLKIGDKRNVDLTAPEDFVYEKLAGKDVQFRFEVKNISEPELPEINEDFAKSMGVEEGGVDKLRDTLKEHMRRELDFKLKDKCKSRVMEQLIEKHTVDVPKVLMDKEIEELHKNKEDDSDENRGDLEKEAHRRIALGLIMNEIITKFEIKVDNQRVNNFIENMAQSFGQPQQVMDWYRSNKKELDSIKGIVLEEQIIDEIMKKAKFAEKSSSYKDVMNNNHYIGVSH